MESTRDSLRLQRMYNASNEVECTRLEILNLERVTINEVAEKVVENTTDVERRIVPMVAWSKVGKESYFCKNCGRKIMPGDKYCGLCGRRYVFK